MIVQVRQSNCYKQQTQAKTITITTLTVYQSMYAPYMGMATQLH